MALITFRQQKTRTALSLAGVVIGSLILILSLAARQGVQDAVVRVFSKNDQLRRIEVWPRYGVKEEDIPPSEIEVKGEMSDDKRKRIRKMLVEKWESEHFRDHVGLTEERVTAIESFDNVEKVIPSVHEVCHVVFNKKELQVTCAGALTDDRAVAERIVAGVGLSSNNNRHVLVHEFVAYLWGYNTKKELEKLIGKRLRLEFRHAENSVAQTLAFRSGGQLEFSPKETKLLNQILDRIPQIADDLPLPAEERDILKKAFQRMPVSSEGSAVEYNFVEEFTICGVFRGPTEEEERLGRRIGDYFSRGEVLLPLETATELALRLPHRAQFGFNHATVLVNDEENLMEVAEKIRDLGLHEQSLIQFVEHIKRQVAAVTWALSAFAAVALFVASLGIANTMVMSVVERTHEIGVMKAVGARDRHVLVIFLVEGAIVGLAGAAGAVLIAFALWLPLNAVATRILQGELNADFQNEHVIAFPMWLPVVVMAFACLVTTLASLLPARKAAKIDPIDALRRE